MEKEERKQRTEGGEDEGERAREEMRRASCKNKFYFSGLCIHLSYRTASFSSYY